MAMDAPIMGAAQAATFDPSAWLRHFEAVGGGYSVTDTQTSLCVAYEGTGVEDQRAANDLVSSLTRDQRAAVIALVRACALRAGKCDQPDLNATALEEVSARPFIGPPSNGSKPDEQPKGSNDMNMMTNILSERDRPIETPVTSIKPEKHVWERAEQRHRLAKAAEELFYASDDDLPYDDAYEAKTSQLCNERNEALVEMLMTPAPDLYALADKLRVALTERIDDGWYRGHEALSMLACDATRLINEVPFGPLYKEMLAARDRARGREKYA